MVPGKEELRRDVLDRRRALDETVRLRYSRDIARQLDRFDPYFQARNILFFMSLENEVETREIMERAFGWGRRVYVPLVDPIDDKIRITRLSGLDIEFLEEILS